MLDKLLLELPHHVDHGSLLRQMRSVAPIATELRPMRSYGKTILFQRLVDGSLEHVLTAYLRPLHVRVTNKVELNPTRFTSFDELTDVLSLFTDPRSVRVKRIDHAVDLPVPLELLTETCYWSHKRRARKYGDFKDYSSSSLSGLYLGQGEEQLCIYDRARHLKLDGPLTRVELRQRNRKVQFPKYLDLPCYANTNPFARLVFQKARGFLNHAKPSTYSHLKLRLLQECILEHGFHLARARLNARGNFKRDFSDLLEQTNLESLILELYSQNLTSFFIESARPRHQVPVVSIIH